MSGARLVMFHEQRSKNAAFSRGLTPAALFSAKFAPISLARPICVEGRGHEKF